MLAFASGTTLWNDSLFVKQCYELSAELPGHGCRESGCISAGLQPVTFVLCGESCFLVFFQNRYFGFAERYYWIQELFPRNLKVCKSCASRGHACPVHFQSSATFYLFFHPCAVTHTVSSCSCLSTYTRTPNISFDLITYPSQHKLPVTCQRVLDRVRGLLHQAHHYSVLPYTLTHIHYNTLTHGAPWRTSS